MKKIMPKVLFLFLFFFGIACGQAGNTSTSGGYIEYFIVNLNVQQAPFWGAVVGYTNPSAPASFSINSSPSQFTLLNTSTGESSCTYGTNSVRLLFSNSSNSITALFPGNLSQLDAQIPRYWENGTSTFRSNASFTTFSWGTITGVPSTYTNSPTPNTFILGYLQDQAGNFIFITRVAKNSLSYNSSPVDFQLMLPSLNGSETIYYGTVDVLCNPNPGAGPGPGPGGPGSYGGSGGGGSSGGKTNASPPSLECSPVGERCEYNRDCCVGFCLDNVCRTEPPSAQIQDADIYAPKYVDTGTTFIITVVKKDGAPIAGTEVRVLTPSNEMITLFTDNKGEVKFLAEEEGWYAYIIPFYGRRGSIYSGIKPPTRITETIYPEETVNFPEPAPQLRIQDEIILVFFSILVIALLSIIFAVVKRRKKKEKSLKDIMESKKAKVPPIMKHRKVQISGKRLRSTSREPDVP